MVLQLGALHEVRALTKPLADRLMKAIGTHEFLAYLQPAFHPRWGAPHQNMEEEEVVHRFYEHTRILCTLVNNTIPDGYYRFDEGMYFLHPVFEKLHAKRPRPSEELRVKLILGEDSFEVRGVAPSSWWPTTAEVFWTETHPYTTDTSQDLVLPSPQDEAFLVKSLRSLRDHAIKIRRVNWHVDVSRLFSEGLCGVELLPGLWVMCGETNDWIVFDPGRFTRAPSVKNEAEAFTSTLEIVLSSPSFHQLFLRMDEAGRILPLDPQREESVRSILRELVRDRTDQTVGGSDALAMALNPCPFAWQRFLRDRRG